MITIDIIYLFIFMFMNDIFIIVCCYFDFKRRFKKNDYYYKEKRK